MHMTSASFMDLEEGGKKHRSVMNSNVWDKKGAGQNFLISEKEED